MDGILAVVIPSACTLIGTFAGILASSKLTAYRIGELEKKVDKHNTVIERTYKLEARVDVIENTLDERK